MPCVRINSATVPRLSQ